MKNKKCKRCGAPATRKVSKKAFVYSTDKDAYCDDCAKDFVTLPIEKKTHGTEYWLRK